MRKSVSPVILMEELSVKKALMTEVLHELYWRNAFGDVVHHCMMSAFVEKPADLCAIALKDRHASRPLTWTHVRVLDKPAQRWIVYPFENGEPGKPFAEPLLYRAPDKLKIKSSTQRRRDDFIRERNPLGLTRRNGYAAEGV